ncbi:MAG: hypothetical protein ACOYOB_18355 [Myxococcota bacterium]
MTMWKSPTCIGKATGKPLATYDSEGSAQQGADHARAAYRHEMTPYACRRCDGWHLAPTERHTPSSTCHDCSSADGTPKQAYVSEAAAVMRARILFKERGVSLEVYECPYGNGWHLTKG